MQDEADIRTRAAAGRRRPPPVPGDCALFLDFDGTLVEFAGRPAQAAVDAQLRSLLLRVRAAAAGAVAVLSGRGLADLDGRLAPLKLPLSGLHGLECRLDDGRVERIGVPAAAVARVRAGLRGLIGRRDLHLEDKTWGFAVHYRGTPAAPRALRAAMAALAQETDGVFELLEGVRLLELKPAACDKGRALARFMLEPPFRGRRPVFIGDDRTDEDGFAAAERAGGFGVAVGPRVRARWWLPDPRSVRAWLQAFAVRPP